MDEQDFRDGEYLKWEANGGTRSRANGVAAVDLKAGQVIGKITASGLYKPWASNATDGSQVVAGINYGKRKAGAQIRITSGHAEVSSAKLVYPGNQLAAITAGLAPLLITVR